MAVIEIDKDYLRLVHICDQIESIIGGLRMADTPDNEKKQVVGNCIMVLETEVIDDKYTTAGKDMDRINSVIATGRTYWKS